MADYVPFNGGGQFPTRPYGPLTGLLEADADFMKQQSEIQSLQDMFTRNQQHQAELERYQGMTPGELAKSNLERQMAQAKGPFVPDLVQGEVGRAKSERAKGERDIRTLDSDVSTQLSTNSLTQAKNRTGQTQAALEYLDRQTPFLEYAESQSPMHAQMAWDKIRNETGLNLPREYVPGASSNLLKSVRNSLIHSVDQEQKLALEKEKNAGAIGVADINRDSHLQGARIAADAANWRANLSTEQRQHMQKLENIVAGLAAKSATTPLTPQERETWSTAMQAIQSIAMSKGAGQMLPYQFLQGGQVGWPNPPPAPPPGGGGETDPSRVNWETAPKYNSEAEAQASGRKGAVIINGRRAIIK
jgi:hypothetical protein